MTHLVNIAIVALAGLGVWTAMGEGMVLHWFHRYVTGQRFFWSPSVHGDMPWKYPAWIQKPLATCPRCMVTVYGTTALIVLGMPFDWLHLPVYLVCAVGLQEMLHR